MSAIDMFRFIMDGNVYTLTSARSDQTYNNELYRAAAIKRSSFNLKNELSKANISVSLGLAEDLALELRNSSGEQIVTLTIFTNLSGVTETTWKGRLVGVKPGDAELDLNLESVFTSLRRPGLRARFQRGSCRHALYGRGCNLLLTDWDAAATVTAITGNQLTVPEAAALGDGYLIGGMITPPSGVRSFIVGHTGTTVTVQRMSYAMARDFADLGSGMAVTLHPGCDHLRRTCIDKFNNGDNYGGFDWIPIKNPMGGSSIV